MPLHTFYSPFLLLNQCKSFEFNSRNSLGLYATTYIPSLKTYCVTLNTTIRKQKFSHDDCIALERMKPSITKEFTVYETISYQALL